MIRRPGKRKRSAVRPDGWSLASGTCNLYMPPDESWWRGEVAERSKALAC